MRKDWKKNVMTDKNCRNCGAPLTRDGDCEYCGTKRQQKMASRIEMTADRLTLFIDDISIGKCVTENWPEQRIGRGYET